MSIFKEMLGFLKKKQKECWILGFLLMSCAPPQGGSPTSNAGVRNDPAPEGTIVATGQFNGSDVTGAIHIYASDGKYIPAN